MDPEEIENRQFLVSLRGYARDEVESFREEVAQEIRILRKKLVKATSELSHANAEMTNLKSKLAEASTQLAQERSRRAAENEPKPPEPAPAQDRAAVFRTVSQETERILLAAEHAAEQIHERALAESAEIMADARIKVEQSLAELEAARRAAEEDFAGIRDSRAMVASQLEDIRRRLEETISRLRVPVELPGSKPVSRFRQPQAADPGAPQVPIDQRLAEAQAQQRRQREIEAANELQARQTAHRAGAERREEELQAVQRRSSAEAELQARSRAAAESAVAGKARQAAEVQAAAAAVQEAERLRKAHEAERQKAAEDASAAVKARAEEQAAASARQKAETEKAEAAAKAKADSQLKAREQAEAEKSAKAKAEAERVAKAIADAEVAARTAEVEKEPAKKKTVPANSRSDGGSSLDELLAEIRRKREEEERQAGSKQQAPARNESAVTAAASAHPPSAGPAIKDDSLVRRSEALGDLPAQTARRLKRLLQEDHNDLLDRLRTHRGKGTLEDNVAPEDEQTGRFVAGLKEVLGRAFAEGRKAGGAGAQTDPLPVVTKLVTRQVLTPLRTEISSAIAAGLDAEDSASALSERANDVFRVWKGVRTQLLGEGIAYSVYHQGLLDVWRSKAGSNKLWVFSEDEAECPNEVCRRNADKGAVPTKEPFPSGHLAPPAHGGCTCTLQSS